MFNDEMFSQRPLPLLFGDCVMNASTIYLYYILYLYVERFRLFTVWHDFTRDLPKSRELFVLLLLHLLVSSQHLVLPPLLPHVHQEHDVEEKGEGADDQNHH